MKTERRHELQTNELADWLGAKIETVKPYSRAILGGLIAVAVIAVVYLYVSRQRAATQAEGWDRYFSAWEQMRSKDKSEDMSELAQSPTYRDTAAGMWARIALADHNYVRGEIHLFNDRPQAKQELQIARDNYTAVANQREYPELAQRALLGKARALESLDEMDEARKAYQTLADEEGGPYQEEAKLRLADLSRDETRQFYDWFAQQDPRPSSPFSPGRPGIPPEFNFDNLDPNTSLFDRKSAAEDSLDDLRLKSGDAPSAEKDQLAPPEASKAPTSSPSDATKKPADAEKKPAETESKSPTDAAKTPASQPPASSTPKGDG